MSILIKGMEMPKKPGAYSMKIRLFVKEDGTASIWGLEEYIPHEPLDVIPVPPHGRLIDADALMDDIIGSMVFSGREVPKEAAIVQKVLDIVGDANAIIPASEDGE